MDLTEIVLLGIAVVALALEVWAMVAQRLGREQPRLISPVMRNDGRIWLIWPWGWGVLAGHFWWPYSAPDDAWGWLIAASVALVAGDLLLGKSAPRWAPFAAFSSGAIVSALTWAMGY